jgi:hypothetical protein
VFLALSTARTARLSQSVLQYSQNAEVQNCNLMNNNLCMRFQLLHRFAGMSSRQRARTAEELLTARQLPPLPDIADAPPIGLADLYRDGTQKG